MKNKKVIGLLLSLVLVLGVALPGTLATSTDTEGSGSEFSISTLETTDQNTETPLEDAENKNDEVPAAEAGAALDTPACTCGTVDDVHAEGCPLYAAPAEPACSCGTNDGVHAEGCPLYTAPAEPALPEKPAHIDSCVEGCTSEGCECDCHKLSLFEKLMACKTLDELFAIVDVTPEDELMALTDEENAEIEAKIAALESEPLPPVVLEECENESVISEIIYPAVNFANVAPFGAPVEG